ncbi:hypothetical protein MPTK1_7g12180 [Marchantia polymorpha subsp. ruderalis]|uniref:Uncharacterized protein n=2 Tax=Marchantia polymorpha TaxID=3197 RepID=A0AAF6BYP0_MARPO|nr:hypothetical protein MARPO_0003s0231 [Marchantia polymorpha]BBN17124.1 hypothetical protein Mp_7g12180 [Marchantia polymorpha subsp. ruderalis]|eukprot:PTQ49363.1 hypothetical protein MARPO_0003s0231 [Marchantia polymorpha]
MNVEVVDVQSCLGADEIELMKLASRAYAKYKVQLLNFVITRPTSVKNAQNACVQRECSCVKILKLVFG